LKNPPLICSTDGTPGCKLAVEDLDDPDTALAKDQDARRVFTAMTCRTLDASGTRAVLDIRLEGRMVLDLLPRGTE
jgi:hypothetical protein